MASFALVLFPDSVFYPNVYKDSIEVLKALETLAASVTTLPKGMALLNATWFYIDVDHNSSGMSLLQLYFQARSIRAIVPPNKLFKGFHGFTMLNPLRLLRIQKGVSVSLF
jgi:hypothetical protein